MSTTPASQRPIRYSSFIDVGNILNTSFSSGSNPTENQVTDMIDKADSWVDNATNHSWLTNQAVDEYHDGQGVDGRADGFMLDNWPVLSVVKLDYWDGSKWSELREGFPSEHPGKQTFLVQYPHGRIELYSLRLIEKNAYRVAYNYGYSTVPDYIRDLSAHKAALLVLDFWGGKFQPADTGLKERLNDEIERLLDTARNETRPTVATA